MGRSSRRLGPGWLSVVPWSYSLAVFLALSLAIIWEFARIRVTVAPSFVPLLETIVGPICHHLPDRTLSFANAPFVVCARCSGVWIGWLAALPLAFLIRASARPSAALHLALLGLGLGSAAALTLAALETLDQVATSNQLRLLLGTPLGAAGGLALLWQARRMEDIEQ